MDDQKENIEKKEKSRSRFWVKFITILIIGLFSLFIILNLLIRIPSVQAYGVRQIGKALTDQLGVPVTVGSFYYDFNSKLVIHDLFIPDFHNDTLLYAGDVELQLKTGLLALRNNIFHLNDITVCDVMLKDTWYVGEEMSDLNRLLAGSQPQQIDSSGVSDTLASNQKKPFNLALYALNTSDIVYFKQDQNTGKRSRIRLGSGIFDFHGAWRLGAPFKLDHIFLDDPVIDLRSIPVVDANSDREKDPGYSGEKQDKSTGKFPLEGLPQFQVGDLRVSGGWVALGILGESDLGNGFKDGMMIEDIAVHIRDVSYAENDLTGSVDYIAGITNTGLELTGASVHKFNFSDRQLSFEDFILETSGSSIGDTLAFKYRSFDDWSSFTDNVLINGTFRRTSIALNDIVRIVPSLESNDFFRKHAGQHVTFSGDVNGRVNNLRLRDFALAVAGLVDIKGNISTRNITIQGEEILNMKIERLNTSVLALRSLIPGFSAPPNFDKLGDIDFSGRFDGYFQDFVAYGNVNTAVGSGKMDMRLDLKNGVEKAAYSGAIELKDFDLGVWSGNEDLGKFTFTANVKNGYGLRGETASADLAARIQYLEFKGYTYRNINFDGKLNSSLLDGALTLNDKYLDFRFNGTLDFSDSLVQVDFALDLDTIELKPLSLSKRELTLAANMRIRGKGRNFDDAIGLLIFRDVVVNEEDSIYRLDSLLISQNFVGDLKQLIIRSPWMSGEVDGQYSFSSLPQQLMHKWKWSNPDLWSNLGMPDIDESKLNVPNEFAYDVRILDASTIFKIARIEGWDLRNARLRGGVYMDKDTWDINGDFPYLQTPGGQIKGLHLSTDFYEGKTDIYLDIDTFDRDNIYLSGTRIYAGVAEDSAILDLSILDPLYSLDFFETRISLAARDSLYAAHVLKDNIQIDGEKWAFTRDNELVFGKNYFYTKNLYIQSGKKEIGLFPMGRTGIVLDVISFNGDLINLLLRDPKFRFDGELSGQFRLNHIFKKEGFSGDLTLEPFIVNGDDHGILLVSAEGKDFKSQINTNVQIFRPGGKIEANGWVDLRENADPQKVFFFDIGVFTFPMVVLDYLVPNGISNTVGFFSGQLSFFGGKGALQLLGELVLEKAKTTIDFIGTRYGFDNQRIVFRKDMIDFTGAEIMDSLGNVAKVTGGLRHVQMKDFKLDARIQSDEFILLNTKKAENADYYGTGIGRADVRFSGDFINTDIYVNATTKAGTRFVIPVDDEVGDVSNSFVRFVKKDEGKVFKVDDLSSASLTGVNLSMDLEVKEEAQVKIIFDEAQGNIMEGYGRGNIQLNITRNGEFTVRGDYEIENGKYLFTLMNFVNKPFNVKRGGVIRWTGDPLDAQIDIEADYAGLRTSLTNFLTEYGLTGQLATEAQRSTEVELTMRLTGSLLRPSIDFSLNFPEVPESLRSYVDSKVRNLEANREQMNTQVFGLIVFRSFLPSNNVGGGILGNTVGSTVGTISEMLANQFSNMISALLSEAVDSWDVVSGVEFNIDYNQPTGAPQGSNDFRFGELAVSQSIRLLNDRWVVTLGANYGNNYLANTRYFSPQVELSWKTPVEGLNLQIYYRTEQFFTGLKQKAGAGLRFHKEYDSFLGLKKAAEDLTEDQDKVN